MTVQNANLSPRRAEVLGAASDLAPEERLTLVKLLLDSIAAKEGESELVTTSHKAKADLLAFMNAAGSWSDVDVNAFLRAGNSAADG